MELEIHIYGETYYVGSKGMGVIFKAFETLKAAERYASKYIDKHYNGNGKVVLYL